MSTRFRAAALATLMSAAPLLAAQVGDTFPGWERLSAEAAGAQVVLVDFWASWCAPCKAAFPELEKLYQEFTDRGLSIIAVNVDKKASDATAFLKKHPVTFKTLHDTDQSLVAGASIEAMPTSFLLDGKGRILATHRGFDAGKTIPALRQEIDKALADGAATP